MKQINLTVLNEFHVFHLNTVVVVALFLYELNLAYEKYAYENFDHILHILL